METELFYVDGQTDGQTDERTNMTKLIVAFRNFSNTPKNFCWVNHKKHINIICRQIA
jgi:hypothetical protein